MPRKNREHPGQETAEDLSTPEETPSADLRELEHELGIDDEVVSKGNELTRELAEWKDRALRAAAELENFRKRAASEAQTARKYANEGLLYDLLPVIDNFQRAVDAAEKTPNLEALKSGVDLIYRQFNEVLEKVGLEPIEAVGQPFDPNVHQAVMQVEPEDGQEPHVVVEELRPGYRFHDRVLRPSMVKVTSG
jgi:molecular chaperone GrpE